VNTLAFVDNGSQHGCVPDRKVSLDSGENLRELGRDVVLLREIRRQVEELRLLTISVRAAF
jgi:hypothetical protein